MLEAQITSKITEAGFQTFSALDYLKIDIANQVGKDKINFKDRIDWVNNNINDAVVTYNPDELRDYVYSFNNVESYEGLYGALLAYQDYWFKRPNGRRFGMDSVSSGIQLMSCLTCSEFGLEQTGLLGNNRNDLYTTLYEVFKSTYRNGNNNLDITRKDIKRAIMTHSYGSVKVPYEEVFKRNDELYSHFKKVVNLLLPNVEKMKNNLIDSWNPDVSEYSWVLPDGYNAVCKNYVMKRYDKSLQGMDISFEIYEQGTTLKSVEKSPNSTHSVDSLLAREMVRRCNFDIAHIQEVLWYLITTPDNVYEPKLNYDNKLEELVAYYELSGFCSIRVTDYIHSIADTCKLPKTMRTKLIDILSKMLQQGNIDITIVHDQFEAHYCNMNYIRYWYKEMCADLAESNVLNFLLVQLGALPINIKPEVRKQFSERIRNSNYGLC